MSDPIPPAPQTISDLDDLNTLAGLKKGDVVLSRFKLERCLGRGGMGEVWLAHDKTLDEKLALKLLPRLIHFDERAVEDLKNETRRGRQLSHPNVVRVFDFHQDAQNVGIAMEFVDGENLGVLHAREPHGAFVVDRISQWTRQLLLGLDYAHRMENVVHRDLKPANLMIDQGSGNLKIADFGIARCLAESMQRATVSAQSRGTLCYMSPEQAMGRGPNPLDDLYAVGATLYQLLAGSPPFYSGDVFNQILKIPPSPIAERQREQGFSQPPPAHWEATILRCLAKERAQRPQSAVEILDLLGLRTGDMPLPAPYVMQTSAVPHPAAAAAFGTHTAPSPATLPPTTSVGNTSSIAIATSAPVVTLLPSATQRTIDLTRTRTTHGQQQGAAQPAATTTTVGKRPFPVMAVTIAAVVAMTIGGIIFYSVSRKSGGGGSGGPPPPPPPPEVVKDWRVPEHFPTIQAAINAAKEAGQKIYIDEKQWNEKISIKTPVHLIGAGATKSIIMVDGRSGSAIEVSGAKGVTIEGIGFSHLGDEALAGGNSTARVTGSEVSFKDCAFNRAMRDGLTASEAATVTLSHCVFVENTEAGIKATAGAKVTALECSFAKNNFGIIAELANTTVTVTGGTFSGHAASGIVVADHAYLTVNHGTFADNKEHAVYAKDSGTSALVDDCEISKSDTGIKAAKGAALTALKCRVRENLTGMAFDSAGNIELRENTVEGNSEDGIVLFAEAKAGTALIYKNTIKGNRFGLNIHGAGMVPDVSGNDLGPNAFPDIYLHGKAAGSYSKNTLRSAEGFVAEPAGTDDPGAGAYQKAADNIEQPSK
ncbi:MAG: protein kinase domain-containing protein [Prosthecobacter sp.]|uniref:protein kinase domain-containing protein n=1 Tax=Prosthecobacter sp. TaxID=1965333 RepID=UPI0038FD4B4D